MRDLSCLFMQWKEIKTVQDLNHSAGAISGMQECLDRPGFRWLKCNVYKTFLRADGIAATGCCVCNVAGVYVLAQTMWKHAQLTVLEGILMIELSSFYDSTLLNLICCYLILFLQVISI